MTTMRHGLIDGVKEHLASGQPITRLEALVLFGVSDLVSAIRHMRTQGWVIQSRLITYAAASKRLNQYAVLQPPANLPTREIMLIEYWISK